jgi:hypothetical protein
MLEGLIVLEYLELGIMPFYPKNPEIGTCDRKANKKVSKQIGIYDHVSSPGTKPGSITMYTRKMIVHRWIKKRVLSKYNGK